MIPEIGGVFSVTGDQVLMQDIFNSDACEDILQNSWKRCRNYGLAQEACFMSPIPSKEEIVRRRRAHKELTEVAEPLMRTILSVTPKANFIISLIDADGYVLSTCGDATLQAAFRKKNLFVGARWREHEVGASAIIISLVSRVPIQVVGDEHYCQRFHKFACAATPLVTQGGELLGSLCISAYKGDIFPNTLGMTIALGKAIVQRVELERALSDLKFSNRCQETIIESIFSGFMLIDKNGFVVEMNELAGKIFGVSSATFVGKHITELVNSYPVVLDVLKTGEGFSDREFFIDSKRGLIKLIKTALPVKNASGEVVYVIETFREMDQVHEFATKVMGARARFTFDSILGDSMPLRQAVNLAKHVAQSDSTVLLQGETGTGKEVFAQAIHNGSPRQRGPYLAINCGAIPRDLMESELFGYVEGAFSGASKGGRPGKFELAVGGTLFLDEIGELPLDMQTKLLRVLEERVVMRIGGNKIIPIDVRVIAASNKNLELEVAKGNFRQDLFYRLNVITIDLPPLRDRKEDVEHLAHHFAMKIGSGLGKPISSISERALSILSNYEWPGNVRELENAIERAVNTCHSGYIMAENLPGNICGNAGEGSMVARQLAQEKNVGTLHQLEKEAITRALHNTGWNITRAAKELKVSRTTLYQKIRKYSLGRP